MFDKNKKFLAMSRILALLLGAIIFVVAVYGHDHAHNHGHSHHRRCRPPPPCICDNTTTVNVTDFNLTTPGVVLTTLPLVDVTTPSSDFTDAETMDDLNLENALAGSERPFQENSRRNRNSSTYRRRRKCRRQPPSCVCPDQ